MAVISSLSALFPTALKNGDFPRLNALMEFLLHRGVAALPPITPGFGRFLRLSYIWPVPPDYYVLSGDKGINDIRG